MNNNVEYKTYIDSMAYKNVFNKNDVQYTHVKDEESKMQWIDGSSINLYSNGNAILSLGSDDLKINSVAADNLQENVISVNTIVKNNYTYIIDKRGTHITKDKIFFQNKEKTKYYDINNKLINLSKVKGFNPYVEKKQSKLLAVKAVTKQNDDMLTQESLAYLQKQINNPYWNFHASNGHFKSHLKEKYINEKGESPTKTDQDIVKYCTICGIAKFKNGSMKTKQHEPNALIIGEHVHVDMAQIYLHPTWFYVAIMTDEASKLMRCCHTQKKEYMKTRINTLCEEFQKETGQDIKTITCDKGLENVLLGRKPKIRVKYAPTGNKEMNGLSENSIGRWKATFKANTRHIPEKIQVTFFGYFAKAACEYINTNFTTAISMSPYEKLKLGKVKLIKLMIPPILASDLTFYQERGGQSFIDLGFMVNFNALDWTIDVYSKTIQKVVTVGRNQIKELKTFDYIHAEVFLKERVDFYNLTIKDFDYKKTNYPHIKTRIDEENDKQGTVMFIPKNITQAFKSKEWIESVHVEADSFITSGAYDFINQEKINNYKKLGKTFIKLNNFWMFTIKEDGRKKSRVIHTNNEEVHKNIGLSTDMISQDGMNYFYSLIARLTKRGYKTITIDCKNAFLSSPIETLECNRNIVYLTKPYPGLYKELLSKNDTINYKNMVEVKMAVYGLANSPKSFETTLRNYLQEINYIPVCNTHKGFFTCFYTHPELGFLVTHVDDILILSKNPEKAKQLISTKIKIKGDFDPKMFLGISLHFNDNNFAIGIEHSIDKLMNQLPAMMKYFVTKKYKNQRIPKLVNTHLTYLQKFDIKELRRLRKIEDIQGITKYEDMLNNVDEEDIKYYNEKCLETMLKEFDITTSQKINGFMNWITGKVRYDMLMVSKLMSKYATEANKRTLLAWLSILRYLYATKHIKIYRKFEETLTSNFELVSDASEDKTDSSISYNGYFFYLNNYILKVNCEQQTINSVNSKQSELYALHRGVEDISQWNVIMEWDTKLMKLLISEKYDSTLTLLTDNKALMLGLNREEASQSIKGVIYFQNMYWQIIQNRKLFFRFPKCEYITTELNSADILTKLFPNFKLHQLIQGTKLKNSFDQDNNQIQVPE